MQKTVCELFAWVGWFRLWLENLKTWWETVWANQREPSRNAQDAYQCYITHFCDYPHMNEDIHSVVTDHIKEIPSHNLLVWGFPCQDYSVARTWAKWIQWKKWVLWRDIQAILAKKKPSFVLLENVDRLLKSPWSQRGRDFWIILACFNELWYNVERRVINAAEYWNLQRRRRTFIFWFKNTTNYAKEIKGINNKKLLHEDWFFASQFPIKEEIKGKTKEADISKLEVADVSEKFMFDFWNSGIMRKWKIYTEETLPNFQWPFKTLWDKWVLEEQVDEKYYINEDKINKRNYLKWPKKIERKKWTAEAYTFSEWWIAFPDPLDRPARTMLTSEGSLNRSTHIVKDKKTWKLRILTAMECERINGFKDNWTNTWMPERFRYFCMGNALVVPLITKMWEKLDKIIEKED
jgi:DNA (cytosine-5)-methyltransferase 1